MLPAAALVLSLAALALLAASFRRIPAGQMLALRRIDGRRRLLAAGTHWMLPGLERVERRINLNGSALALPGLQHGGEDWQGMLWFQVVEPERIGASADIEGLLDATARRLFAQSELPEAAELRRQQLKAALNERLRGTGVLVARVDLQRAA